MRILTMDHLTENIKPIVLLKNDARIKAILADGWVGYPRAKIIINRMEELLDHPKILRMPNMLLLGSTCNGKTHILNRFFMAHKPIIKPDDTCLTAPVVYVQSPQKPDPKLFYNSVLDRLNSPHGNDHVAMRHQQVLNLLRRVQTKVLIIDEIHHTVAGPYLNQRIFLNMIKFLSNELQIVIIAAGIKDAYNAINADPQLANRFEPAVLPRWQMNAEYLRLLASFESVMPLKNPSNLIDPDIAMKILSMSEGYIGEIAAVIKRAAIAAIQSGTECISKKVLSKINYISPTDRKKEGENYIL